MCSLFQLNQNGSASQQTGKLVALGAVSGGRPKVERSSTGPPVHARPPREDRTRLIAIGVM